jgi:hypothetical protein
VRVGHRLQRGEGLGRDDEQRLGGIQPVHRFCEVAAIDVGNEAERQVPRAVVAQCLVSHHRPEVGAADADVDDVPDALAGVARPTAAAHPARKGAHAVEYYMHVGYHVVAIKQDGCRTRCAQGHVQHRAPFRDVDPVAAEHGVDPFAQAGLPGQLHQQAQRFIGDAVLGIVQVDACGLQRKALTALRILREQVTQMNRCDRRVVRQQRGPGRAPGKRRGVGQLVSPLVGSVPRGAARRA